MTALPLPASSRRHLLDVREVKSGRYVARFAYFVAPKPEAVMKQFDKLGLNVRRWEVDGRQAFIDVWYGD